MARDTSATQVSERTLLGASVLGASVLDASVLDASVLAANGSSPPVGAGRQPTRRSASSWLSLRMRDASPLRAAVATELERGTAFLLIPVFLALGAIFYFNLAEEPRWLPLLGGTAIVSIILRLVPERCQALRFLLAALLICLAGILCAKAETWRAGTQVLGSEISTQLTGRVRSLDHMADGRVRLTIDVTNTARPRLRYAPQRVRVSGRKVPAGLRAGSPVTGMVRLLPPTGPVRPGSYDFSFKSYFDGIGASGFFLRGPEPLPQQDDLSAMDRFRVWVEDIRDRAAERVRGVIGGPEGEIAAALVVGVRAGIPEDINEAMRRSGIYHIISISGLHMALVAGTVMGTLRALFAVFPGFASRHPIKKYAAAMALAGIAFYLFISGAEVAAQRSFIMLAIMLVALLFDRAALTMRNLAISAIIVIAVAPHEVIGPSFQMSFAATAALVGAYALWSERRRSGMRAAGERSKTGLAVGKLWGLVVGLAVTSVVAGLATAAFGAYHFQRVSPLSLLANLAVMPVVSLVVMPFGVAGSIAMPLGLDGPFFVVMGKGLGLMIALSKWFSDRTPIDAVGLVSVHSIAFLTVALILATMATTWLRLAALPFVLIGLLTLADVRTPDALVSEDGRLLAMAIGDGRLAVSRARPNEFAMENWQRALRAETIVKPEKAAGDATLAGEIADLSPGAGFVCGKDICTARHPSGALLALAATVEAARSMCGKATLIVLADSTARNTCRGGSARVITTRELARSGSAAIHLIPGSAKEVRVDFALAQPYRPWHAQRAFSRAARGLPPYKRNPPAPAARPSDSSADARSNASRAADQPREFVEASRASEPQ